MNPQDIVNSAQTYMEVFHKDDATGHDIAHVMRVVKMAKFIAQQEQVGDLLIIQLASLFHDTVDAKLTDAAEAKHKLKQFLTQLLLPVQQQEAVLHIIEHMSYKNGENNDIALSIEGQIVRDADRLDAIGAIGIARTFQFAGHFGEPMWAEGENTSTLANEAIDSNAFPASAIKHFHEKLFKLKALMHTPTAKQLAQQRHEYMELFVTQFFNEWYFK
ncbi:HD domain-containing protein [Staphylococcus equorum]|uniref:HD domain-containing protein n=1 Tax=Staphylococcus equorum TaxID=246432 RepID=A0A9X4R1S3_9STAP|nr:HD domain-containing protein [Staphylococcus equorum]MDG0843926.1 HD domain-containing protein [Staphylococcus equorum]MDG0860217.1 HD domain-containing protein [Staphylococcus equorum]